LALINAKTSAHAGTFTERFGLGDGRAAEFAKIASRLRGGVCDCLSQVVRGRCQLDHTLLRPGEQGGSPGGIGDGRNRPQLAGCIGGGGLDAGEQARHIANGTVESIGNRERAASTSDRFVEVATQPGHLTPDTWSVCRQSKSCALHHRRDDTLQCPNCDQGQSDEGAEQHDQEGEYGQQPLHSSSVRRAMAASVRSVALRRAE
jgi:hypothetical protein